MKKFKLIKLILQLEITNDVRRFSKKQAAYDKEYTYNFNLCIAYLLCSGRYFGIANDRDYGFASD